MTRIDQPENDSLKATAAEPPYRPPEPRASRMFWMVMLGTMVVVGLLALAQYNRAERAGRGRSLGVIAEVPVLGDVPEFKLTERSGKTITRDSLRGKVWIADFIFTCCAGPCPIMSHRMAGVQAELDRLRWADVRLVSISVDPERDTPDVLEKYANKYGASKKQWLFLTGPKADIYDLSIRGFKVGLQDETAEDPIIHSTRFVLVDRRGRIRGYFDITEDDPDLQRMMELPAGGKKGDVDQKLLRAVQALLEERPE